MKSFFIYQSFKLLHQIRFKSNTQLSLLQNKLFKLLTSKHNQCIIKLLNHNHLRRKLYE